MLASTLVTLLILPATLVSLTVVVTTAGYTARVPSGPDAMGLALPFFTTAGAGLVGVLASWVCLTAGRLNWISPRPALRVILTTLASLGVALASLGVLVAWMEKMGPWVAPVGLICGALGPVCLAAILLGSVWLDAERIRDSALPIVAGTPLTLVALAGFGAAAYALAASPPAPQPPALMPPPIAERDRAPSSASLPAESSADPTAPGASPHAKPVDASAHGPDDAAPPATDQK